MTETRTDRPAASRSVGEEEPRCLTGSASENPCWRPATEKRWPDDEEPTLCVEDARLVELGEDED